MNRIARGPKSQLRESGFDLGLCVRICVPALCAPAEDGAVTGVAKCETKAAGEDGKGVSSSCTDCSSC